STSTAGMVGITERGPVNVPILTTSYGEYVRWFGERLNPLDYANGTELHCFMAHGVEGFFTNGGKRVFVTRVLDVTKAENARTLLFGEGVASSAATQLIRGALVNAPTIYVADVSGFAVNDSIRIGSGSGAEYDEIQALPATASDVELRLPLSLSHAAGTTVDLLNAPVVGTAFTLSADANPGDSQITLGPLPLAGIAANDILQLGATATHDDEYVFVNTVDAVTGIVTLNTPLLVG